MRLTLTSHPGKAVVPKWHEPRHFREWRYIHLGLHGCWGRREDSEEDVRHVHLANTYDYIILTHAPREFREWRYIHLGLHGCWSRASTVKMT